LDLDGTDWWYNGVGGQLSLAKTWESPTIHCWAKQAKGQNRPEPACVSGLWTLNLAMGRFALSLSLSPP